MERASSQKYRRSGLFSRHETLTLNYQKSWRKAFLYQTSLANGMAQNLYPGTKTGPVAKMKAYDITGVLVGMLFCAMSIFLLPAKAAVQSPSTEAALYQELRESWDDIFPTANHNAGGAMFFKTYFGKLSRPERVYDHEQMLLPWSSFIR